MNAIEFTTDLTGTIDLKMPVDVAARLPRGGKVRVIVLMDEAVDDGAWRLAAYEQFLRDDAEEDAVYESCR